MKIRITRGTYGYRENGNVIEKTKDNGPFEVNDEEGKRLIALRVAKLVNDATKEQEDNKAEESEESQDKSREGHLSKEQLESMNKDDLSRLAEELGIQKTGSKKELVERLSRCTVGYEDEELLDEDEMPTLSAEDPD